MFVVGCNRKDLPPKRKGGVESQRKRWGKNAKERWGTNANEIYRNFTD